MTQPGALVLEDGRVFPGLLMGDVLPASGEVVFNTGLTGYQEILTDPSYFGQLVVLTVAHVGNTGINGLDNEQVGPGAAGLIVRELCEAPSNGRSEQALLPWLQQRGIPVLAEVDTRALTHHLRIHGTLRGRLVTYEALQTLPALLEAIAQQPSGTGADFVQHVTCRQSYRWDEGTPADWSPAQAMGTEVGSVSRPRRVTVIDCGVKRSILRTLVDLDCQVTVVPAGSTAAQVLETEPNGVLISNGPGDPGALPLVRKTVSELLGRIPLFGICLGHQLLALAAGARVYRLPTGHHGLNHPVQCSRSGRVVLTSHNHGFSVDAGTLPEGVEVTHIDLFDGTCEGLELPGRWAFSVQFHPEAGPGPHEGITHFHRFIQMMDHFCHAQL